MMKPWFLLGVITTSLAASAACAGNAAVETPIHRMMTGFNTGDIAAVKALHVASPTIVDNFTPFRWAGPDAFDHWLRDMGASEAKAGRSGGSVWFGDPVDEVIEGDHAYVVTPCRYTFTQKGQTLREAGYTSFTLIKEDAVWKVESWAWASAKATPAK